MWAVPRWRPSLSATVLVFCHFLTTAAQQRTAASNHNRAPGPNMCKVQHVLGSKDRFFTHCIAEHLKVICERPTYERWECCSGFQQKRGEQGCTLEKPLDNIVETSRDLGLSEFISQSEGAGLLGELTTGGAYTVFAPTDQAIAEADPDLVRRLSLGRSPLSLVHYHVAPGRLNVSTFRERNHEFVTLHNGDKVRVNKYAYGVATVNCARIIRPDEMATNGVVHVIDKVIDPADMRSSIAERVTNDDRFSKFKLALLASELMKKLRSNGHSFTLLAPTNEAFSKLPNDVLDKILTDADTAEKVLNRHIVRGVYCADAIVVSVGLKTLDDARLLFRCKKDGLWVNEAKLVHPDLVASNGVIHGIDTVLLPDSVKPASTLLKDMQLSRFLELASLAGLNQTLTTSNITLFTPTDQAFKDLPMGYLAALSKEPLKMQQLLLYHMVQGHVTEEGLVGDTSLGTLADLDVKIKVKITRQGVTVDKANLEENPRECENALIHKVDKVMVPPEKSMMEAIADDSDLSIFQDMILKSGMPEVIFPNTSFTVLAPSNRALSHIEDRQLSQLLNDTARLKSFVQRHLLPRMILKCSVPELGVYTTRSVQSDPTNFAFDHRKRLHVNKHARITSDDILTSDGVLYKIDHVLPCTCEPSLRNDYGQYFSSHNYRRRY